MAEPKIKPGGKSCLLYVSALSTGIATAKFSRIVISKEEEIRLLILSLYPEREFKFTIFTVYSTPFLLENDQKGYFELLKYCIEHS